MGEWKAEAFSRAFRPRIRQRPTIRTARVLKTIEAARIEGGVPAEVNGRHYHRRKKDQRGKVGSALIDEAEDRAPLARRGGHPREDHQGQKAVVPSPPNTGRMAGAGRCRLCGKKTRGRWRRDRQQEAPRCDARFRPFPRIPRRTVDSRNVVDHSVTR
jgi:hypothetical protein